MSMFLCANACEFTNMHLKQTSPFELYEYNAFQILTLFRHDLIQVIVLNIAIYDF